MKPSSAIILKQLAVGPMQNFAYFLGCAKTKQVAVVDPAWEVDRLRSEAAKENLTITRILLTHGHYDHSDGVDELLATHDVPVYTSKHERNADNWPAKNLKKTSDGDVISIGEVKVECIWTPGHTSGGQCFRCGDILLTGDTLFINACGRCDLPSSGPEAMYETLYKKIMSLPDATVIYPGHAYGSKPYDTLGNQKKTNPYLRAKNRDEFLEKRMGLRR